MTGFNIIMIVNSQLYIKRDFVGYPNFGRRTLCNLNSDVNIKTYNNMQFRGNCIGIDKIILKLVLPKLPDGIKYKNDCIYDLLKNIALDIGGTYFFKYSSAQLKKLEFLRQKNEQELNPHDENHNVIYYSINLNEIFGESTIKTENKDQIKDLTFKGLRLCELFYQEVRLCVDYNDIFSIIENTVEAESNLHTELTKLEMIDCSAFVNYVFSRNGEIKRNKEKVTKQKIKIWKTYDEEINGLSQGIKSVKIPMNQSFVNSYKIKKLIFECDQGKKLKNYLCQINGSEIFEPIDPNEMNAIYELNNNKKLDENTYAIDLDSMSLKSDSDIVLSLEFTESINGWFRVNTFLEIETECIYSYGMFHLNGRRAFVILDDCLTDIGDTVGEKGIPNWNLF